MQREAAKSFRTPDFRAVFNFLWLIHFIIPKDHQDDILEKILVFRKALLSGLFGESEKKTIDIKLLEI